MCSAILITPLTNGGEQDALLTDPNSDISQEVLKDIDFCKKLKSAILTAWTKARSAIKTEVECRDSHLHDEAQPCYTQIAESLGDDPTTELNTEGLPNRRPSSIAISQLCANILQSIPGTKSIKPSVVLAARIAFLVRCVTLPPPAHTDQFHQRYCYTLYQSSGGDYWKLVDKTLEEIRETLKDPSTISQCVCSVQRYSGSKLTVSFSSLSGNSQRFFQSTGACTEPPTR